MTDFGEKIEDKLSKVKYKNSSESHLKVCQNDCQKCKNRSCEIVCPANVYNYDEQKGEMNVAYENCLECGACRIACDKKTLIWDYPKQGFGVTFKKG